MSTRGHSTIDRIVSATLEERERERERERKRHLYTALLLSLARSRVFPSSLSLLVLLSLRARLFSLLRSLQETLLTFLLLTSVDEYNDVHRTALPSLRGPFFVPFIDSRYFDHFSFSLSFSLSLSLSYLLLAFGRFGFQEMREEMSSIILKI